MKVLLIDHHQLFREGLCHVLQKMPMGVDQILEAGSFSAGLKLAEQLPDIIFLELCSPECDGVKAVKTLHLHFPLIPLIILSGEENAAIVSHALRHGASGYVCKSSSGTILLSAMESVLAGNTYVPVPFLQTTRSANERLNADNENVELTRRQQQVLFLLHKGYSNKRIAREINLMEGTVKIHVAAIFQTLQVNKRTAAVQVAKQRGWL